ncbi:twin-arginine translocase TatA/TatE family subunit [Streptomyces sp. NPDC047130]|uniref:twin-arginine translocase TatA/TatE family subunit n=1 Tax=Streptomyces sp. NPDC047130 TaxID=3155261 RepID=UPI0033CD244B
MFGLSELAIILIVVVLLLGAKRLPDLARAAGRSARILKAEARAAKKQEDGNAAETGPGAPANAAAAGPGVPADADAAGAGSGVRADATAAGPGTEPRVIEGVVLPPGTAVPSAGARPSPAPGEPHPRG